LVVKTLTNPRTIVFAICAILALSGCATSAPSASGESGSRDRNLITKADMEGMDQLNALEAIRRLKPQWLQHRGRSVLVGTGREGLRVYMNRHFFGEAEALNTLMARDIQEIRYLDARQATLRFGTDHTMGAIVITTGGG
jgi:hypothetical protein